MANIEYYTFGEVTKALGIPSSKVNDLIDSGKLKPVRHLGVIKFSKTDVESIQKEEMLKQRYTWMQVLRELQIEDAELQRLISEGDIKVYKDYDTMSFDKKDIESYKHLKQVHDTIVVEKQGSPSISKIPEIASIPIISEIQIPDMISSVSDFLPTLPKIAKSSPSHLPKERYYSQDEVLTYLQIEASELKQMIADGDLSLYEQEGKRKFSKSEIDFMRSKRMVDATMVVESVDQKIETEEDDLQPIIISANMEEDYSAPVEEYYTFDEALYELQIDSSELKRMISRNEIHAKKDKNGLFLLIKEEIDAKAKKIEPTVILPDEDDEEIISDKEETMLFPDTFASYSYQEPIIPQTIDAVSMHKEAQESEKSFYSVADAAVSLKASQQQVEKWLQEEKIRLYHYLGKPSMRKSDLQKLTQKYAHKQDASPSQNFPEEKTVKKVPSILSYSPSEIKTGTLPPASKPVSSDSIPKTGTLPPASKPVSSDSIPKTGTLPPASKPVSSDSIPKTGTLPPASKPVSSDSIPKTGTLPPASKPALAQENPGSSANYTLQETLQLLKVDQKKLLMMVASGEVKYKKIGKSYLFDKAEIDAIVSKESQFEEIELFEIEEKPAVPQTPKIEEKKKPQPIAQPSPIKPEARVSSLNPPIATPSGKAPALTPKEPKEEETCTIQEAIKILSVGKSDIQRFIDGNYLTLLPGNRLRKKELQDLKKNSEVDVTMVLPLTPEEEEEEEEDAPALLNAPKLPNKKMVVPPSQPLVANIAKPTVPPLIKREETAIKPKIEIPKIAMKQENTLRKPEMAAIPVAPAASFNPQNYYTLQQVLTELQLEKSEIDGFIHQHGLRCIDYQGKKWIRKEEIDGLKTGKMIEPTIMVGNEVDDILEDDDDDMFFRK